MTDKEKISCYIFFLITFIIAVIARLTCVGMTFFFLILFGIIPLHLFLYLVSCRRTLRIIRFYGAGKNHLIALCLSHLIFCVFWMDFDGWKYEGGFFRLIKVLSAEKHILVDMLRNISILSGLVNVFLILDTLIFHRSYYKTDEEEGKKTTFFLLILLVLITIYILKLFGRI